MCRFLSQQRSQRCLTLLIVLLLLTTMLERFFNALIVKGAAFLLGGVGFVLIERPRRLIMVEHVRWLLAIRMG